MFSFNLDVLDFAWVTSGLLLIPYLLWGYYLLRQRIVRHLELDRAVETFTVAGLLFFFIIEFNLLHASLSGSPFMLTFASIGLLMSAIALYGPLLMSFGSHLIVDVVMPTGRHDVNSPQYGSAAACETRGDYEAAAREYAAISKMFPKEKLAALRAGDNFMKSDRAEDAAPFFEAALDLIQSDDEALPIVNRLHEIYLRRLSRPEDAREVLQEFIEDYPDSEYLESVKTRLAAMEQS